jgi:hypothetical protein
LERDKEEVQGAFMIDLKFGLFWSGSKLSYLRYLTFKSLRHYHPDAEVELYTTDKFKKDGYKWNIERQDFELEDEGKNYMEDLSDLGVKIYSGRCFEDYAPNYQSDFFRWWWLSNNSGFYLDTDQIILRSFETLPRDSQLIYSGYKAKSCGYYTPVGVIGADKPKIVDTINKLLPQFYVAENYNSLGPFMFKHILEINKWDGLENVPSHYFYPLPESYMMSEAYQGDFTLAEDSYAFHWFGGLPLSQKFNTLYDEEVAKRSKDTISRTLRDRGII